MKDAIQVLEWKLKELSEKVKLTRKLLRRKSKPAIEFRSMFIRWDKRDKERIASIKRAIKYLKQAK